VCTAAFVKLQGRNGVYAAVVEVNRAPALICANVLEEFDFLDDGKKLYLVPRDPDYVLSEIE